MIFTNFNFFFSQKKKEIMNSDTQTNNPFQIDESDLWTLFFCFVLTIIVIMVSVILFTKKLPPEVESTEEDVEKEDKTEIPLPKSSNANSLRAYNFAMTMLMLTGAVFFIFSSKSRKEITYFDFILRMFFLFWFVSSFVLSIRTLFSKFLTSKLLEWFLFFINIGFLSVYFYKLKKSHGKNQTSSSNAIDRTVNRNGDHVSQDSTSSFTLDKAVEDNTSLNAISPSQSNKSGSTVTKTSCSSKMIKNIFMLSKNQKIFAFLFIGFCFVYLEFVINIYAWKLGYGRNDDEANPQLGLMFMIFQIIWFLIYICLCFMIAYFYNNKDFDNPILEFVGRLVTVL